MGIKDFGWSSSPFFRARFFSLALVVSALAALVPTRNAYAVDQKKAREKIVELNRQALLSYEGKDFDAAKESLNKALKEAKTAALEDDKMTARTYLHLGAVFFTGYQDQAAAIQNFTLAKKIRPDIQLTPSIETPELKAVFDQATAEAEPATPPAPEPEPVRTRPQPAMRPEPAGEPTDSSEPDLPSAMSAPLMCSTPEEASPGRDLMIRCALKPGLNGKSVQMYYRAPGAEAYQALPMQRTPKGWYTATIPGRTMKGPSLQVYYDARDGRDNEVASNGQIDSPSVIEIRKKGTGTSGVAEGDPLARIREQQRLEKYESGLHRRRQGAVWFGFGAGTAWGYAPAGNLEWARDIKVSAITTVAGMFQMVFDAGYMLTDNISLGLQFRLEYIQQQQLPIMTARSGAPTQWAPAFLLRPTYFFDITSGGNFQLSVSANAGGGYVRLPVKPVARYKTNSDGEQVTDEARTISKTDTRPVGTVLIGPGAGLAYHLSRHFSIALEGRLLAGFPNFGMIAEGDLQLQIAFGGKSGPVSEEEEGEEGETGAVHEQPADASERGGSEEE